VTIPKTGMAKKMRMWMSTSQAPFTVPDVCDGLGVTGRERTQVRYAMADFIRRGEIRLQTVDHRRQTESRRRYLYNQDWRREQKGLLKPRVIKAIYVSASAFSSADIQRISGVSDGHYVDRIIRQMKKAGHIQRTGKRHIPYVGAVQLYNIVNRDKFRIEVM